MRNLSLALSTCVKKRRQHAPVIPAPRKQRHYSWGLLASQTDEMTAHNSKFFFFRCFSGPGVCQWLSYFSSFIFVLKMQLAWSLGVGLESLLGCSFTWLLVRSCSQFLGSRYSPWILTLLTSWQSFLWSECWQGSVPRKKLQLVCSAICWRDTVSFPGVSQLCVLVECRRGLSIG